MPTQPVALTHSPTSRCQQWQVKMPVQPRGAAVSIHPNMLSEVPPTQSLPWAAGSVVELPPSVNKHKAISSSLVKS